jgi:Polyketide cyclase / dehydrase and lipid transport
MGTVVPRDLLMRVSASILVNRPIEDVFPYLVDLSTTSEWDPNIAEARKLTPGDVAVGSEFELVAELRGRRIPFHYRLTSSRAEAGSWPSVRVTRPVLDPSRAAGAASGDAGGACRGQVRGLGSCPQRQARGST